MERAFPHELSGGMLQRVMIAMALAVSPRLLIADEPTTALDVTIQQQILELVEDIQARTGMAVVWVTHDLGVVARIVDQVVVMYAGRVVEKARRPASCSPARAIPTPWPCSAPCPTGGTGHRQPLTQIGGTPPDPARLGAAARSGPAALSPSTAARGGAAADRPWPGARRLLDAGRSPDEWPSSPAGDRRREGVPGPANGRRCAPLRGVSVGSTRRARSGSSARAGAASRRSPGCSSASSSRPRAASSSWARPRETARPAPQRLARRIQLVFQDPFSSLNPRLTVSARPERGAGRPRPRLRPGASAGAACRRAPRPWSPSAPASGTATPTSSPGGQAQRVAIARALAVEPRLLVLDEPTSALDVSVRAEVMNLLTRLQDELALSYVFISHDLAMVRHISDVISVMYLGKVVESGPYEAVLGSPLHPYTRALAEAVPLPDPELEAGRRKAPRARPLSFGPNRPGAARTIPAARWPRTCAVPRSPNCSNCAPTTPLLAT